MPCRGTKDFAISLSTDRTYWNEVVRGVLPDYTALPCEEQKNLNFEFEPQAARYVRFVAESYYGTGAGLQFFNVSSATPCDIEATETEEQ